MKSKKITGTVEFVATSGRGGVDAQINNWITANPDATIVDVHYQVAVYQDGGKNKMAKLALVLFNQKEPDGSKGIPESESKPGARTMVMNLRKDLDFGDPDSTG